MNLKNLSPRKAKARIKEWPVTFGSNGLKLTGKVLLPDDARADSPVPGAVLCHGFGGSHRFMKSSAKILAEQGIATLVFDFRGHGASEGAIDGRQADDAVDAWNALKQFPEVDKSRMGIIGHSLGAMSAILAAGKVDSPRALVALSCPPIIDDGLRPMGTTGQSHFRVSQAWRFALDDRDKCVYSQNIHVCHTAFCTR